MDDLIAFLTARLDEDEAVARRNIGSGPGVTGLGDTEEGGPSFPDYQTYDGDDIDAACDYLNHFRPLRALRDIEADRELIAAFEASDYGQAFESQDGPGLCVAVRIRAARFSDHPDYRQEWAQPSDT